MLSGRFSDAVESLLFEGNAPLPALSRRYLVF